MGHASAARFRLTSPRHFEAVELIQEFEPSSLRELALVGGFQCDSRWAVIESLCLKHVTFPVSRNPIQVCEDAQSGLPREEKNALAPRADSKIGIWIVLSHLGGEILPTTFTGR